jgi:hypothetical protein
LHANLDALRRHHPSISEAMQPWLLSSPLVLRRGEGDGVEGGMSQETGVELFFPSSASVGYRTLVQSALSRLPGRLSQRPRALLVLLGCDPGFSFPLLQGVMHQFPAAAALVAEPDLRFFALLLALVPLDAALASNRVTWCIGLDWQPRLQALLRDVPLFGADALVSIPSLSAMLPDRLAYWSRLQAELQRVGRIEKQRFAAMLHAAKAYYEKKNPAELRSVMMVPMEEGNALVPIQRCLEKTLHDLGIRVIHAQPSFHPEIGFMRTLCGKRPDFLLLINHSPCDYAPLEELNQFRLPRMIWIVDDPHCFIQDSFTMQDFVFTWDPSYADALRGLGARAVDPYPHAADVEDAEAVVQDRFHSPLSFIGAVKALRTDELGLSEEEITLARWVGDRKARDKSRSYHALLWEAQAEFGFKVIQSPAEPIPRFLRYAMYCAANAVWRISVLEQVMDLGLKIYGNRDWEILLADRPMRACYAGPADPVSEAPSIFVSSTINLNIHSVQGPCGMNQRNFNIPWLGGFVLSDRLPNAADFFIPGQEMVFYDGLDDVREKCLYYLQHEDERRALIRRGRERIFRDHTYNRRLASVLVVLKRRIRERYALL